MACGGSAVTIRAQRCPRSGAADAIKTMTGRDVVTRNREVVEHLRAYAPVIQFPANGPILRDFGDAMTTAADDGRREQGRERSEAFRERRRHGRVLVKVEVGPHHLAGLERLALLDSGERDRACIAWAVSRFLDAAPHVSALGDALWPAEEEESKNA